jgi:hypothetical protein
MRQPSPQSAIPPRHSGNFLTARQYVKRTIHLSRDICGAHGFPVHLTVATRARNELQHQLSYPTSHSGNFLTARQYIKRTLHLSRDICGAHDFPVHLTVATRARNEMIPSEVSAGITFHTNRQTLLGPPSDPASCLMKLTTDLKARRGDFPLRTFSCSCLTLPVSRGRKVAYIYIRNGNAFEDRLCGLVVRVLGYRSGGPGSIPSTTKKK